MSDGNMTYEDWLRGCVHHDGRHGYVTLPCDEVLKIADFIERLRAERKTENSSEIPNNCDEPTWEQVKEYCNKRCLDIVDSAMRKQWYKDEPQTERNE